MYVPEAVVGREFLEDDAPPGQRLALWRSEARSGRFHTLPLRIRFPGELDLSNPTMDDLGVTDKRRAWVRNN